MNRCIQCILPDHYPGISFNNEGICNYCTDHKEIKYLGEGALREKILSHLKHNKNREYDCLLGFSGGRDSSFLLHYLVTVLNLKVLACTIDTGYMPEQTFVNVKNISNLLNADLVIEKRNYLQKCIKHHVKAWLRKPSLPMVAAMCSGCRLALAKGCYDMIIKYNTPIYIAGGTPFEGGDYRTNLLRSNPYHKTKKSLMLGYLSQVRKNPSWLMNPYCSMTQFQEFRAFYGRRYKKKMQGKGILWMSPYHEYIRWEEKKIISTIEDKLHWKKNPSIKSKWRGDCDIALLKLHLYQRYLGFNDKDDALSDLIRDGQITRQEALDRLDDETFIPEEAIKFVLDKIGIEYAKFKKAYDDISPISG